MINPRLYNAAKVQSELRLPSFFVFGCEQEGKSNALPSTATATSSPSDGSTAPTTTADLLFSLKKRRHEVVDFCIRQYEGVTRDFLSHPVTAEDAVCGQEAIIIGSAWLDVYGRRLVSKYRAEVSRLTPKDEGVGQVEQMGTM